MATLLRRPLALPGIESVLHPEFGCINFRDGEADMGDDGRAAQLIKEGVAVAIDRTTGLPTVPKAAVTIAFQPTPPASPE